MVGGAGYDGFDIGRTVITLNNAFNIGIINGVTQQPAALANVTDIIPGEIQNIAVSVGCGYIADADGICSDEGTDALVHALGSDFDGVGSRGINIGQGDSCRICFHCNVKAVVVVATDIPFAYGSIRRGLPADDKIASVKAGNCKFLGKDQLRCHEGQFCGTEHIQLIVGNQTEGIFLADGQTGDGCRMAGEGNAAFVLTLCTVGDAPGVSILAHNSETEDHGTVFGTNGGSEVQNVRLQRCRIGSGCVAGELVEAADLHMDRIL